MIECTVTCQRCDAWIILSDVHGMWVACCPNCIDDDPSSEHEILQGTGCTPEDALQNWFDNREMLGIEPEIRLTPLGMAATQLAAVVVPATPDGWVISPDPEDPARLFFESLSSAERHPELGPIYYGPMGVLRQRASNDS